MSTPTEQTYRQRIQAVQRFIQEHLDEELPLERLARVAHFSPFHFHRIFKALVGEGVAEHVRRLRLQTAAMLLRTTERPVTLVAFDSGYTTHEAFTRAFRQAFGVAPSQYRAGRRAEAPAFPKEEPTVSTLTTTPEVRLRTIEPLRVAYLRHLGPYQEVGPTCARFFAWAGCRGLLRPDTLSLGVCWDDPNVTPPEQVRYDACVTVGPDFRPEDDVGVQTIEGGEYAVMTYRGPYRGIGASVDWVFGTWLPASGREPRHAPLFEVHHVSPPGTPPEEVLSDIYLPLAPA